MNKKLIAVILTVILTISVFSLTLLPVSSATYYQDGDWKYEKSSENSQEVYYLAGYTGTSSSVKIPALFQTKPVTKINNNTFINNTVLSYVEIPATVKCIGMNAFYGCTSLETVSIPRSVAEIGPYAFYGCASLVNVAFTSDSALCEIPRFCFSGCASLEEVVIPQGVKIISDRAFLECISLTDITISPSVTEISENAFKGVTNLRIHGWEGTYAQEYAQLNSIPFVSLGENPYPVITTTSADEIVPTSSKGQETIPTTSSMDEVIPTSTQTIVTVPTTVTQSTTATVPTTSTQSSTTSGQAYIIGDSDLDGKITVKDATIIQKYAAGLARLDRTQLFLANCDGTGGVNVKDATQIQKYCAGFKNIRYVGTEVIF